MKLGLTNVPAALPDVARDSSSRVLTRSSSVMARTNPDLSPFPFRFPTIPTPTHPPPCISMHAALQLTEILTAILSHCSTDSVGRAAAVCQAWEEVANGMLWRNVTSLWTLLQLLGPMEDGDKGTMFSRPFAELNWRRFMHHAQRVRELDYDYGNKGQKIISPDAFVIIATTRPQLNIVPYLDRLVWVVVEDVHFAFAQLFMHKDLKKLHLVVLTEVTTAFLRDFLERLPIMCPKLTDLDLSFNISISSLEPVLTNMFAALPELEIVTFPAFGITSTVLCALSQHQHLKRLHARPFWGLGFSGEADDVKAINVTSLPESSFPSLQELDLDSGFGVLRNVLSAPCIPRSLTRLYVSAFEGEPLAALTALLDLVSRELTALTFLGLAYLVKPPETETDVPHNAHALPRITLDVLRPALRLCRLHSFHVMHNRPLLLSSEDIAELGRAWGGPAGTLRSLRLAPDPVFAPDAVADLAPAFALGDLQAFARALPLLERLEVYIDATRGPPTEPPAHAFAHLTKLDVGISPIAQPEMGAIARWLAKLVPHPELTLIYGADWSLSWAELSFSTELEHLLPRRNAWQRVGEMHMQLCILAEESSKEIKRLAEQLRMLKQGQSPLSQAQVSLGETSVHDCLSLD